MRSAIFENISVMNSSNRLRPNIFSPRLSSSDHVGSTVLAFNWYLRISKRLDHGLDRYRKSIRARTVLVINHFFERKLWWEIESSLRTNQRSGNALIGANIILRFKMQEDNSLVSNIPALGLLDSTLLTANEILLHSSIRRLAILRPEMVFQIYRQSRFWKNQIARKHFNRASWRQIVSASIGANQGLVNDAGRVRVLNDVFRAKHSVDLNTM